MDKRDEKDGKQGRRLATKGRKASVERPAALLVKEGADAATPPVRTRAQLRLFTDGVVDQANRGIRRGGLEHDAVADLLMRELFHNDAKAALDPDAHVTQEYAAVRERAGKSLKLLAPDLSRHIRVGALNQLRRDGAWLDMDWSKKVELLPLLADPDGHAKFNQGVIYAGRPNVGIGELRDWVHKLVPKEDGSDGRPRGKALTLQKGKNLADSSVVLSDEAQRAAFVAKAQDLPEPQLVELVDGLTQTHAGLGKLLAELRKKKKK